MSSRKEKKAQRHEYMSILEESRHILNPKTNFYIREAYNTLRTNVIFSLTGDEKCKVVVVTSSNPGEGKSITAVNLAISLSETDKRVLIVDCDMRKPKLHRLLDMKSDAGVSDVLVEPEKLTESILRCRNGENLYALLAGRIPPNPSELLGSQRMQRLLASCRENFDYIILDTPPVNMVTDAVVLTPFADGTLFVVRANMSERGPVLHAMEQLEYSQSKILGVVFNGIDMQKTDYGYKKYGYRRYGYKKYGYYGSGYGSGYGYGYGYGYAAPRETGRSSDR